MRELLLSYAKKAGAYLLDRLSEPSFAERVLPAIAKE